ncbi:MAG: type II toxin-antitoxin system HicA family toxin [Patescibacteria group bacterium]
MPKLAPISRRKFIIRLKAFGFIGPFQEGKHPFMTKSGLTLTIPNEHDEEISVDLLSRILRQSGIGRDDWVNKV